MKRDRRSLRGFTCSACMSYIPAPAHFAKIDASWHTHIDVVCYACFIQVFVVAQARLLVQATLPE